MYRIRCAVLLLAWVGLMGAGPGCRRPAEPQAEARRTIAVIPKGTTHVFWKSVEAGAKAAGAELGVEVLWKGPLKENDRALQIAVVEQFVTEGVAGIVLAPLDNVALLRPVRAAAAAGIPVVIIDSALNGEAGRDFVSFVATDNRAGGRIGGAELLRLLGGSGRVALLRYQVGSASTDNREAGFLEALAPYEGIQLLVENQYAGATVGEAIQKSEEILDKLREADGVFCPNESSTYGMLVALRKNNLAGRLTFVGFDASPDLVQALRDGEIDALVVQNPRRMGYEGVRTMVAHLDGTDVPDRLDTGVELVTRENMDDPAIQALIAPE